VLGLVFGIQVIQVAVELVKAMNRRQEFVAVPEMVLAELSSRVALRLEERQFRKRRPKELRDIRKQSRED
jgi:hypothetical protein